MLACRTTSVPPFCRQTPQPSSLYYTEFLHVFLAVLVVPNSPTNRNRHPSTIFCRGNKVEDYVDSAHCGCGAREYQLHPHGSIDFHHSKCQYLSSPQGRRPCATVCWRSHLSDPTRTISTCSHYLVSRSPPPLRIRDTMTSQDSIKHIITVILGQSMGNLHIYLAQNL